MHMIFSTATSTSSLAESSSKFSHQYYSASHVGSTCFRLLIIRQHLSSLASIEFDVIASSSAQTGGDRIK